MPLLRATPPHPSLCPPRPTVVLQVVDALLASLTATGKEGKLKVSGWLQQGVT